MTFGGAVTATYMHAICIWHVRSKLQCIYLQKAMNQNSYINEAATAITNSFDILQIKQIVYWYQECTKKWLTELVRSYQHLGLSHASKEFLQQNMQSPHRGLVCSPSLYRIKTVISCTCCTLQEHAAFNQNPWHVTSYRNLSCLIVVNYTAALFF